MKIEWTVDREFNYGVVYLNHWSGKTFTMPQRYLGPARCMAQAKSKFRPYCIVRVKRWK